ncbi:MAG: LiaF-related protein [Lachnospiraceae bacterium]
MKKYTNKLWGILLLLVATYVVATNLGYFQDINIWKFAPITLFAILAIQGIISKNITQTIFSIGLVYVFLDEFFPIVYIGFLPTMLVCLLVSLALPMIFPSLSTMKPNNSSAQKTSHNAYERIDLLFGDSEKYIHSQSFEGAFVRTTFGSAKLYLDQAVMLHDTANVHIVLTFGDTFLFVPKNWEIDTRAITIFGDTSVKGNPLNPENTLIISGNVTFGDLHIIYI